MPLVARLPTAPPLPSPAPDRERRPAAKLAPDPAPTLPDPSAAPAATAPVASTAPTAPQTGPPLRGFVPPLSQIPPPVAAAAPAALLVVDDSAVVRAKLKKLFDGAGYQVSMARDGLQALDLLRSQPFDLLITDLEMPQMDGLALIAAVQARSDTRALPILAITGHDQAPAELTLGGSLRGVLRKPWADHDLLAQVAAALPLSVVADSTLRRSALVQV